MSPTPLPTSSIHVTEEDKLGKLHFERNADSVKCETCNTAFGSYEQLSVHRDMKPVGCTECEACSVKEIR